MEQIIAGYKYLLQMKVLHRDLKPPNILQSGPNWKICDFGLARKIASSEADLTQEVVTMWYRPP
jgi:serine/threonine protein kinase